MASIEKRRDKSGQLRYRVRIRRKGAPDMSQSFTRLTDARAWAQRIEADLASGRAIPNQAQQHTLQEAIDRYLSSPAHAAKTYNTRRQARAKLVWWAAQIGDLQLSAITLPMIIEYRDELLKTRKPNTVRGYLAWIRHLFNIAKADWQWIDQTPFTSRIQPSLGAPRLRFLSDDERTRLLEACESTHPRLYIQVVLALSTGARQMELVRLTWRQVDFDRWLLTFEETKTHQRRSVTLAGLAYDMLRAQADRTDRDPIWVFPPGKTSRIGQPRFNSYAWGRCVAAAGLDNFRFHDLRHTAASYLAMNGASLLDIAHILGHKSISMTQRYAHLTSSHTAQIIESMNHSVFGSNTTEEGRM